MKTTSKANPLVQIRWSANRPSSSLCDRLIRFRSSSFFAVAVALSSPHFCLTVAARIGSADGFRPTLIRTRKTKSHFCSFSVFFVLFLCLNCFSVSQSIVPCYFSPNFYEWPRGVAHSHIINSPSYPIGRRAHHPHRSIHFRLLRGRVCWTTSFFFYFHIIFFIFYFIIISLSSSTPFDNLNWP